MTMCPPYERQGRSLKREKCNNKHGAPSGVLTSHLLPEPRGACDPTGPADVSHCGAGPGQAGERLGACSSVWVHCAGCTPAVGLGRTSGWA